MMNFEKLVSWIMDRYESTGAFFWLMRLERWWHLSAADRYRERVRIESVWSREYSETGHWKNNLE